MEKRSTLPTATESQGRKPQEMPLVSVMIVNFNGRIHLERCLPSLVELDYPKDKLEIVVVDNASTDDSVRWLKQKYHDVRLLENPKNLGFAGGMNSGAEIATGSYLALLNADMRVEKDWLSSLVKTVRSGADVVCAGSIVLNWVGDAIDYAGRPSDALNLCPEAPASAQAVLRSANDDPLLFASGGAMLVQRDVFLSLGGFDRDYFLYHEDVDLGWRLWLRGYRVLRSARSLVYHRGGASSKRLSPEFVMSLAQKYALSTVVKNVEDAHLWSVLTGVLWFLVERSRWFTAARLSLGNAIRDLTREMETVWRKRVAIQSQRARGDAEIFAACGHPFGFLASNSRYRRFELYLSESGESLSSAVGDATSASHQIIRLLYHAYKFSFEESLKESASASKRVMSYLSKKEIEESTSVYRVPMTEGRRANVFLASRMEQVARRIVPPAWRHYLRPVWGRITNRFTGCTETMDRKGILDGLSLDLLKYISERFDRFGRVPFLLGRCNICGNFTAFFCNSKALYRESLNCAECLTTSRYRSVARGILRAIHELGGVGVESIAELAATVGNSPLRIYDTQIPFYTETHAYPIPDLLAKCTWIEVQKSVYLPKRRWGSEIAAGMTNQNLEGLTFSDNSFDIVITSDVMEHVRLDDKAHNEIRRVLKPGGIYCFTVPHYRDRADSLIRVVVTDPSDPTRDEFIMEREYHGDANAQEGRALSYRTYGTDLDEKLLKLGFTVDYSIQDYPEQGIMSSELFYCRLSK